MNIKNGDVFRGFYWPEPIVVKQIEEIGEDYYPYVIFNAASKPEFFIVKNPAESLHPEEKIEIVRYIMGSDKIKEKGKRDF